MVREIISIGVGQCGVQLGHQVWRQYNAEHEIQGDRKQQSWIKNGPTKKLDADQRFLAFYRELQSGIFAPRNIFIDTEPSAIDRIQNGDIVYHDHFLLSTKEDTGSNYAAGHYTLGKEIIDKFNDRMRKLVDECDNFQGVLLSHSVGGGTGSGLGALILERLAVDYRKTETHSFDVYPSPTMSACVVEPYNALLSMHWLLDYTQMSYTFDNEAVYGLCHTNLEIKRPSYHHLNRLIRKPIAGITADLRFESVDSRYLKYEDLSEYQTALAPFPRLHFIIPSFVPIVTPDKMNDDDWSVRRIAASCLSAGNFFVKVPGFVAEEAHSSYLQICLNFNGAVKAKEANSSCQWLKTNKKCCFLYGPTGFKVGLSRISPVFPDKDDLSACSRSCTYFANNLGIHRFFRERIAKKSDKLYLRRAYVHWFVGEGMEEGEFAEAREDLSDLEQDYKYCYGEQMTDEESEGDGDED